MNTFLKLEAMKFIYSFSSYKSKRFIEYL